MLLGSLAVLLWWVLGSNRPLDSADQNERSLAAGDAPLSEPSPARLQAGESGPGDSATGAEPVQLPHQGFPSPRPPADEPWSGDLPGDWAQLSIQPESDELSTQLYAYAEDLRDHGGDADYAMLASALYDPQASSTARERVLTIFRWAETPEAAGALATFMLQGEREPGIDAALRHGLLEIANSPADNREREQLTPIYAQAWEQLASSAIQDQAVMAQGLSVLGTAGATQVLVASLMNRDRENAQRRDMAASALGQLQNDEAVPTLSYALAEAGGDAQVSWPVIAGLVSINSAVACNALLESIGTSVVMDQQDLMRLEDMLSRRGISDAVADAIGTALQQQLFGDARVVTMLSGVLAHHAEESSGAME